MQAGCLKHRTQHIGINQNQKEKYWNDVHPAENQQQQQKNISNILQQ